MVRSFLFLILICLTSSASAQSGIIQGRVTNGNGDAIEDATVELQGTQIVTITDLAGNYKFVDIPAGTYTLQIGANIQLYCAEQIR